MITGAPVMLTEVVVAAILDLWFFAPSIARIMLKKAQFLHRSVTSDIPGNPHVFDRAIISLFRTLPELSNLNFVWTSVPLDEPIVIRGCLPPCRFSSLSIYSLNGDSPNSLELMRSKINNMQHMDVLIAPHGTTTSSAEQLHLISGKAWTRGFLSMRNYLVPPGTKVTTPEVIRVSDGRVIRPAQSLIAGPAKLQHPDSMLAHPLVRVLLLNILLIYVLKLMLNTPDDQTAAVVIIALGVARGLYGLCFFLGKKRLSKLTAEICAAKNKLYLTSLEQGSKASQPSRLHKYWMMRMEVPHGKELAVRGKVDSALQKYWSLIVYDEYGLPLPQYVYDANVTRLPVTEDAVPGAGTVTKSGRGTCVKTRSSGNRARDGTDESPASTHDIYSYDIRLSAACVAGKCGGGRVGGGGGGDCDTGNGDRTTPIDLNTPELQRRDSNGQPVSRGYVLLRLCHPADEQAAVAFSAPTVEMIDLVDKKYR